MSHELESQGSTPVTPERRTRSTTELSQAGTRRQVSDAAQSKRKISATGSLGKQLPNVGKEDNAMVKRKSSTGPGQPRKKIPKRNSSAATARKGKDERGKRDYSQRTNVPSGFFGIDENANGVQIEVDSAWNIECEPAGRS